MIDDARLYRMLGERIRKLREESVSPDGRLTQGALAAQVGLERTSITNIENGNQKVTLHVLYGLCEALGVGVADVLPAVSEVDSGSTVPVAAELQFGGKSYSAPPKTLRIISQILNKDKSDDQI